MPDFFHPLPDGAAVAFNMQPVPDEAAGPGKFKEVPYVRIVIPGDRNSGVHRPYNEKKDTQRLGEVFRKWKADQAVPLEGTPLENWAGCSRSQVEELKHFHVRTVEQLAGMTDANAARLGLGYPELRQRAKDYVAQQDGAAPLEALRTELQAAKAELAAAQEALEEARASIRTMRAERKGDEAPEEKPRRKRQPKEE